MCLGCACFMMPPVVSLSCRACPASCSPLCCHTTPLPPGACGHLHPARRHAWRGADVRLPGAPRGWWEGRLQQCTLQQCGGCAAWWCGAVYMSMSSPALAVACKLSSHILVFFPALQFQHFGLAAAAGAYRCKCGAPNCRGTMDTQPERTRVRGPAWCMSQLQFWCRMSCWRVSASCQDPCHD